MAKMSLEEKLGQLVMLPFHGDFISSESGEYRELQRAIEENHAGGFMLGTRIGRLRNRTRAALCNGGND